MSDTDWCYIIVRPGHQVRIDTEDLARVSQHKWRITKGTQGRLRVVTSIRGTKGVRSITLGRFLMNPPEGLQVYPRRFKEGLDYRKSNLIVCTLQERQRLLPKNTRKTTSSYRGVSFNQNEETWRAAIEVNSHSINLGNFKDEDDAAEAYNRAALQHFGPMAYQNQIGRHRDKRQIA